MVTCTRTLAQDQEYNCWQNASHVYFNKSEHTVVCYARHNGDSLITGQQAGQSTRDVGPVLGECCASINDAGTTFIQRWAAVPRGL